jgi:hypothetical protein
MARWGPHAGYDWSWLTTPWGLPCFVRFPCVHVAATTPAQRLNVSLRSFHPDVSVFPDRVECLAEVGSIVCHGPVDDPKSGWGLSIFSAKDQTEVERLTAADPIILDDVGATYEILLMKRLRMKGAS